MRQFSLLGLLLFMLGVGGGVSAAMHAESGDFAVLSSAGINTSVILLAERIASGITCPLVIWVALGLAVQAWDIVANLRRTKIVSKSQQTALRFAAIWRVLVAALLPGTYLLQAISSHIDNGDETASTFEIVFHAEHLVDLRWLLLLLAIGIGGGFRADQRPRGKFRLLDVCGLLMAVILGALLTFKSGIVWYLIAIAINGVEVSEPLELRRAPVGLALRHVEERFVIISLLQFAAALLAFAGTWRWTAVRGIERARLRWGLIAGTLALAAIGCEIWIQQVAIPEISPSLDEVLPLPPQLATLMIVGIAVLFAAARVSYSQNDASIATWRRHTQAYLHERRLVLAVAAVVALVQLAKTFVLTFQYQILGIPSPFWLVFDFVAEPDNYWLSRY